MKGEQKQRERARWRGREREVQAEREQENRARELEDDVERDCSIQRREDPGEKRSIKINAPTQKDYGKFIVKKNSL